MKRPPSVASTTRQNAVYRHMIDVAERVADAALGGADAAELTSVFAKTTRKTVLLLDPAGSLRAASAGEGRPPAEWDPHDPVIARVLTALAAERRPLRVPAMPGAGTGNLSDGCVATPIAIEQTLLGYLLVLDDPSVNVADDVDLLIVSYAATLFALTLSHERATTELGLRYQGAVVDALVAGHFLDASDARRKALSIGLPTNVPYRVGVLRVDPARCCDLAAAHVSFEQAIDRFGASVPGVVAVGRGWEAITIVPEPDARPDREAGPAAAVLATLAACVRDSGVDTCPTAGLSERTAHPELAPRAMRQAELSIDLGLRLGRSGQVIAYDELGIYRLLLQIGDMQQLYEFAVSVLGPLLEYDATHKLELVRTLSVYLSEHASLKQAARRLRVHTNTISYRMQRIEQLTPLDMADPEDRLVAHVAVKIIESLSAGSADPPTSTL